MDVIDQAQQRQQEDIDQALARLPKAGKGRPTCENLDCGEPISAERQALGAVLCIDCQRDDEARAARWRTPRG